MTTDSAVLAIHPAGALRFANYSNPELADEMGRIDAELEVWKKRQDEARAEMTRRKAYSLEGFHFIVVRKVSASWRFSSALAKKGLGQAKYDALKAQVSTTTFTVTEKRVATARDEPASDPHAAAEALFRKPT